MSGWRRFVERPSVASLRAAAGGSPLRRSLGFGRLLGLGVGAMVGAGAFSVMGLAAQAAGPNVWIAVLGVAAVCVLVALCYAELSTLVPASGSSYSYALASMGPLAAWIVAWSVALSYVIGNGAVASSLSANLQGALAGAGVHLPRAIAAPPGAGGVLDLPAALAVLLLTLALLRPVRESAAQNVALVALRAAILGVFVVVALFAGPAPAVASAPSAAGSGAGGILAAAGLFFFAFLGFETVSAAAEESRDPARTLPRAMIVSILAVALLYVALSTLLVRIAPPGTLATGNPLGAALRARGFAAAATLTDVAGVFATLGVLLVYLLASTRIFLAMAPRRLAKVGAKHGTPGRMTLLVGGVTAASAAFLPLDLLVSMTSESNLFFFAVVCLAVPILRRVAPEEPRAFRAPVWAAYAGAVACGALMATFAPAVHWGFLAWLGVGVMLFAVGKKRAAHRENLQRIAS